MRYTTIEGDGLGADLMGSLIAEIHLHLEQMIQFAHRRDHVPLTAPDDDKSTYRVRADFRTMWHAGRALELALHGALAVSHNKLLGREFRGAEPRDVKAERGGGHALVRIYEKLVRSDKVHPDVERCALPHIYLHALHTGMRDVGDEGVEYRTEQDWPFLLGVEQRIASGRESTRDHTAGWFFNMYEITHGFDKMPKHFQERMGVEIPSFWKMPHASFSEFLAKADKAYYGQGTMRFADYWWRDHQDFRPYVRVGSKFFNRLVLGLVKLIREPWMWEESYFERQLDRLSHQHEWGAKKMVEEWLGKEFPERSGQEDLRKVLRERVPYPDPTAWNYDILHENSRSLREVQSAD